MRAYLVAGVDAEAGLFPDDPTKLRVTVAHLDLALSPVFAPVGCARGLALQDDGLPVEIHVPDVPDVFRPVKGQSLDSFVIQRPPQVVAYGRLESRTLGLARITHDRPFPL